MFKQVSEHVKQTSSISRDSTGCGNSDNTDSGFITEEMIYFELCKGIRKQKYKYYSESDMFTVEV